MAYNGLQGSAFTHVHPEPGLLATLVHHGLLLTCGVFTSIYGALERPRLQDCRYFWATIGGERKTRKVLEPATGIEPATCGLRNS